MSDFKATMHKIRFPWGSALDLTGGAYIAVPKPTCCIYEGLLLRGGERGGEGKEWKRGRWRAMGWEWTEREEDPHLFHST